MARVLHNGDWFQSVRAESWSEADYEAVVLANAAYLFPQWITVPFHADIVGEDGSVKRPDIALIDPRYRRWCVVEVELSHHSLVGHVLPQIGVFATAQYNSGHARALHAADSALDLTRLEAMMTGEPPQVLVVVDRPDTNWGRHLQAWDVGLSIVEPFRDANDRLLLRVNGDVPALPSRVLTRLSRHELRRVWRVRSPAGISNLVTPSARLEISLNGSPTYWQSRVLSGALMLICEHGDVLKGWKSVDLLQQDDGTLMFQTVSPE